MSSSFTLPSFAKINWSLRVTGKRDDGFHELCTIFQTVSLHDNLTFSNDRSLTLTANDPSLPTDERNLIVRAANALRDRYSVRSGAAIHLEKRIPSPGGLGGGSSNAAVALIGLTRLWQIDADPDELGLIGAGLGSDVPFFFHGGTALGTGRGDVIEDAAPQEERFMLIVTPAIRVSTAEAFVGLRASSLTKDASNRILRVCRDEAGSLDLRHSALINDFEASVFGSHPEIERVKLTLVGLGAVNAAMSGSGASVFATFDKQETRQAALKALDHESTWRKFAVATISRSEYHEALRC